MDKLLDAFRRYGALKDIKVRDAEPDEVSVRVQPNVAPDFAVEEEVERIPTAVRHALASMGISRLYTHQTEAVRAALEGKDILLESPTASGKTLSFNIPLVAVLSAIPASTALMIFPMKALANDQRRQLAELTRHLPPKSRKLESWLYDGDMEPAHRSAIRRDPPAILLSNPEYLHQSFLGWSDQWIDRFLRHLRFLIIDEIHEYRGYFGSNFAFVLRRFLAKLRDLGSSPQLVLATATCANPLEHAERLTGRRFTLIREQRGMRPRREVAFINPKSIPSYRFHEIFRHRIARAALACIEQGLSAIVFCPTRKFAEDACRDARRDAPALGVEPEAVVPYRSGYDAATRRDIEQGLRDGKYRAVFSTNALEIGIDIGRLDACILAGFPDNVMSAWQRMGRAGRSWERTAYIAFFAMNGPVDQFYVSHIDVFLDRRLDQIMIGLDNEELMSKHVPYALHEAGWELNESRRDALGRVFFAQLKEKARSTRPMAKGRGPNYMNLNIRGGSGATSRLIYKDREIGTISESHQFREAYIGAVFNHFGKSYRVVAHRAGEVVLEDVEPYLRTEPRFHPAVVVSEVINALRFRKAVATYYGKLTLFENYDGYRLIDERTHTVVQDVSENDAKARNVRAFWLSIEGRVPGADPESVNSLRAVEQMLRVGSAFVIPCDRHDVGTHTSIKAPRTVYFYETVPGGIGVAEKMFDVWKTVLTRGMSVAEHCACTDGCPRCVLDARAGRDGGRFDKPSAMAFAMRLLECCADPAKEVFDPETGGWKDV